LTTYREKLKDIRWLTKRLQILERDNWLCKWCGVKGLEYNDVVLDDDGERVADMEVHHFEYPPPPLDPWDCPNRDLISLCSRCHDQVMRSHDRQKRITGEHEKERLNRRTEIREQSRLDEMDHDRLVSQDRERWAAEFREMLRCLCNSCSMERASRPIEHTSKQMTAAEYEERMRILREQAEFLKKAHG
jgi:hypothetical protein